jgi:hypothetical protein
MGESGTGDKEIGEAKEKKKEKKEKKEAQPVSPHVDVLVAPARLVRRGGLGYSS